MPFGTQTMVVRRERDNVFAVVRWQGINPWQLRERITAAVTRWVGETEEGKKAWKDSSGRFNLWDLSEHLTTDLDNLLTIFLNNEGVFDLEVEVYNDDTPHTEGWMFDAVLVAETVCD